MRPQVIGLYSPAPRCGKTTVAATLAREGYTVISFATPLKQTRRMFLRQCGLSDAQIDEWETVKKEEPIPELGVSCRHLDRTLGTEWGRRLVKNSLWTDIWARRARQLLKQGASIVCDDMRFLDEMELIKDGFQGLTVRVTRPGVTTDSGHASDGALDLCVFDRLIVNDGSLGDLRGNAMKLLE